MKIAVVGLGLIGGSIAKAIKRNTKHNCYAIDINADTIAQALSQEAIDGAITPDELSDMDMTIVSLYPEGIIKFVKDNASKFKKGSVVLDTCGIKTAIVSELTGLLRDNEVSFVGCHPMAGREFSGFEYSVDNLFDNASFIITPSDETNMETVEKVKKLAEQLRFRRCVLSTPQKHDEVIAFTSQLAHIVSSAYVKSPSLLNENGFSAGSFKDMTRVALLNEDMWTSLFMLNREALTDEISHIIGALNEYLEVLRDGDSEKLHELLKQGRQLKESSNKQITDNQF